VLVGIAFGWMLWPRGARLGGEGSEAPAPTTYGIGNAFLTHYVLPFEIASIVLLAALIGRVVVSRKEVKGSGRLSLGHFVALRHPLRARALHGRHAPERDRHPDGHRARLNSANVNYVAFARYANAGYDGRCSRSSSSCSPPPRRRSASRSCSASYQTFETIDVEATDRLRR
jgi:hypothetical protein